MDTETAIKGEYIVVFKKAAEDFHRKHQSNTTSLLYTSCTLEGSRNVYYAPIKSIAPRPPPAHTGESGPLEGDLTE